MAKARFSPRFRLDDLEDAEPKPLTDQERRFLEILRPEGATINVGLSIGKKLHGRGLIEIVKFGRYGLTAKGREALK